MKLKVLCAGLAIGGLLLLGGPSIAELNTMDEVPAATLLLPYFEVDLDAANSTAGLNTFFSVNNASAAPAVAHVTVWSDFSVPVIDWNIFLTGYDVETVSLWNVFVQGDIPETAHAWNDPLDSISPHGTGIGPHTGGEFVDAALCIGGGFDCWTENPQWDSQPDNPLNPRYPLCDAQLPISNPALNAAFRAYVRAALTGQEATSPADNSTACYGFDYVGDDNIARGYITIDNVSDCNLLFPADPNYWTATRFPIEVNQLWGDFAIIDSANNSAFGEVLVHIEGVEDGPGNPYVGGQDYTFYGRYLPPGYSAVDRREPLGNQYAVRYTQNVAFDGGTDYIVWRDSKVVNAPDPVPCAIYPFPYPLAETQIIAFDTRENATELCFVEGGGVISPPVTGFDPECFPLETQRKAIGIDTEPGEPLLPPYSGGWMYLNLNTTVAGINYPPASPDIAQSYVLVSMSALNKYEIGYQAIELSNSYDLRNELIVGDIFVQGAE